MMKNETKTMMVQCKTTGVWYDAVAMFDALLDANRDVLVRLKYR
jgi:hypothetical protein